MDNYKILGQDMPAGDTWTDAYYVPAQATVTVDSTATLVAPAVVSARVQTLVTSIIVCGLATSTFSIGLTPDNPDGTGTPEDKETLFSENVITADTTEVLSLGLTLGVGNTIWVKRAAANVAFTIMGIEIT